MPAAISAQCLGVLTLVSVSACGSSSPSDSGADALQSIAHHSTVTAGGSFEGNFIMKQTAKLTCDFFTSGIALRWDVHTHEGGANVLDTGLDSATQIVLVAPADGGYSVQWENLDMMSTELDVSCAFEGDVQFHSWYPDEQ